MGLMDQIKNNGAAVERTLLDQMPKIELHRHLEGTYPIESLFKMAIKNELDVPKDLDSFKKAFQFPKDHGPDFLLFLSKFKRFWYKTIDDVANITHDSVRAMEQDHLHYIELRFNPLHFTDQTNLDPGEVTKTIIQNADDAAGRIGMDIRYILTFNRNSQNAAEMLETFKLLHDVDLSRVVGIDLAGDEINFPPELFVTFFDEVKKSGRFGIDIHAGEVNITDSKNMWVSIDQLHADRIGHGVASINDVKLQETLRKRRIFLAMCITSNFQTGAWEDESTHPMGALTRAGVPVNISSDDPTIQDTLLTDDYEKASRYFDWSLDDLIESNRRSVESCFLSRSEKVQLLTSYNKAVDRFKKNNNLQ